MRQTTNIVSGLQTYRNLLLHKRAFGFAVQPQNGQAIRAQVQNWLANLGTLAVIDIKYGVAALRPQAAVLLNASSAFLGS
jgi:hypothetical protein